MVGPRNYVLEWLNGEAWSLDIDDDSDQGMQLFGQVLQSYGFAPRKMAFGAPVLHPLYMASISFWDSETNQVTTNDVPHYWNNAEEEYNHRPVYTILEDGAHAVRRNYVGTSACLGPRASSLEDENTTDYIAIEMKFSRLPIKKGVFSMTTEKPGGWTKDEMRMIDDFIPALSRIAEVYMFAELTQVLMETYLGKKPGQMVMDGQIKRGDGMETRAVIWFNDLRKSVQLATDLPRDEYIKLLNDYFDCVAGAVLSHGGEVLRYIGDAALAIFPIGPEYYTEEEATQRAADAVKTAWLRMEDLNARRTAEDKEPLKFGLGLHIGEVTYGNIGVAERLEFTVIGEAANRASRLQDQTKVFDSPLVVSEEFMQAHKNIVPGDNWRYLGEMNIRVHDTTISLYAPKCDGMNCLEG